MSPIFITTVVGGVLMLALLCGGALLIFAQFLRKVDQGQALVRNGVGGTMVRFSHCLVFPVLHRCEFVDISIKRVEIERSGPQGLICRDNIRADIKVAFFVRVNKTQEDVLRVAQAVGCARASDNRMLQELFESKFSEALKTCGRKFDFVDLYNARVEFKDEILKIIGTDLNGYSLDDCAIDFLEQTKLENLDPENILDAEGIKKITELTAKQRILANHIDREREKTITQQDVEAQEAVLMLNRQLAEAEEKQKREIATIRSREHAEAAKVAQEERRKAEGARILADEEIQVAEENKGRALIVAQRNKERADAVEIERIEKDRLLEVNERERVVALASIEKERAIEVERKNIQEVIRERVSVERAVVEERERILDTEAFAAAERNRKTTIIKAECDAQELLLKEVKLAEAQKQASQLKAEQDLFSEIKHAEAERGAAELLAQRKLIDADASLAAAERAAQEVAFKTVKIAEAEKQAAHMKAEQLQYATVKQAEAEREAAELSAMASERIASAKIKLAEGISAEQAAAGLAEARVIAAKVDAEATGIIKKADAMRKLDAVSRDHEEFRLRLAAEKDLELARIDSRKEVAARQAEVLGAAFSTAKVDIVGGDGQFFDRIANAVSGGMALDHLVDRSAVLTELKDSLLGGEPGSFARKLRDAMQHLGVTTEDVKNLTVTGALVRLLGMAPDVKTRVTLEELQQSAMRLGLAQQQIGAIADGHHAR